MHTLTRVLVALLAASCIPVAPTQAAADKLLRPSAATKTSDDTAATRLPDYRGVKHALGVLEFENEGGFFSEWTLGENLRAMLESALFATGRFVIVERGELGAVLAEQNLQKSGRAAGGDDVAQTGRLRSARFLAAGTITEASMDRSGEGLGLRIRGIRIGGSSEKAAIVAVVKLIDSTTGEIVASERIRGEAGHTQVKLGYAGHDVGADLGAFARTPLGEAAQDCIDQAVTFIATKMEARPIEGVIVTTTSDQVVINLGENFGVHPGEVFVVRSQGEVLTDPATGEVLDRLEGNVSGVIEVTQVREKISYCKLVEGDMPARGDVITLR